MALEVTQQLRELPSIVSITAVPELQEVIVNDKEIELGAGVTQVLKNSYCVLVLIKFAIKAHLAAILDPRLQSVICPLY